MLGFFIRTSDNALTGNLGVPLMSGPQFAHIQTWSRKPNAAGQSIDHIIAEANRDPEFSTHVENPAPPRVLLGNPTTFAADHATHVAARSTIAIMADGSQKSRAIRNDRHTMPSIVMSYPVPRSAIVTDEAKAKLAAWFRGSHAGHYTVGRSRCSTGPERGWDAGF